MKKSSKNVDMETWSPKYLRQDISTFGYTKNGDIHFNDKKKKLSQNDDFCDCDLTETDEPF